MASLLAWMAPVALMFPMATPFADSQPSRTSPVQLAPSPDSEGRLRPVEASGAIPSPLAWSDIISYFSASFRSETVEQMRFEERIIIRIPRRPQATGSNALTPPIQCAAHPQL